jgi:hypothetical protein
VGCISIVEGFQDFALAAILQVVPPGHQHQVDKLPLKNGNI